MSTKRTGRPPGRPSIFSPELAALICARLADGESMRAITRDEAMPSMTQVFKWLREKPEFTQQYVHARELQAEAMVDDLLHISDDSARDSWTDSEGVVRTNHDVIARSKLRVDTRKWIASKLLPKKYGEFMRNEITGRDGAPIAVSLSKAEAEL